MAQPTLEALTLNAGAGGSSLAVETIGTKLWQVVLVGYSTGDGTANVVTTDTPLPVSAAALPLPAGAATSALQGGGLPAALGAGGGLKVDSSGTPLPVSGTFWQATQPVSGTVGLTGAVPAGTNLLGKASVGQDTATLYNGTTALTPAFLPVAKNGSGANELVAADATKKIRVLAMMLYGYGTAVNAYLQSASTAIFGGSAAPIILDKTGATGPAGFCLPFNPLGWCETAVNEALNLNLSTAQYVGGVLVYVKV